MSDITAEEIEGLYKLRVKALGPVHAKMREINDIVNDAVIIPLNELNKAALPAVANLLSQGLYQMAYRFAEDMPAPYFPVLKDGQEKSKELARLRKRATTAAWNENSMDAKLMRRALHVPAYGRSCVTVGWNPHSDIPTWKVYNPLDAFPAPVSDPDDMVPSDCIFASKYSATWLLKNYADKMGYLRKGKVAADSQFRVLEYVSAGCTQLVVLGADNDPYGTTEQNGGAGCVAIESFPNRAQRPLAVVANRVTLDKLSGSYNNMIGMYFARARLQALNEIAIERGIFPTEYLVSHPGENAQIIVEADGLKGIMGVVKGGTIIQQQINPGYKTDSAIDRMEHQERMQGGIPAELSGESASNIRTGRRGENLLSSAIDPVINATRRTFEKSLVEENKIFIALQKAYSGDKTISFFIPARGSVIQEQYVPNKIWETDAHYVKYPLKTDMVEVGQRLGLGLMSKETARKLDPMIADDEMEADTITVEKLTEAGLQSFLVQASDPNGPYQPLDVAKIIKYVAEDGLTFQEAIIRTDQAARDRQAAQVPVGSPDAQNGLAMPGMGGPSQPTPPPSLQDLVAQLRGGGAPSPAGAMASAGR